MMTRRNFALILILVCVFAGISEAAKKSESDSLTERKIVEFFTRINPELTNKKASEYAVIITEAAKKFNQDSFVIAAIIVHESTVRAEAVSKGGDYGLMQIHWSAHKKVLKQRFNVRHAKDLFKPRINIFFGTEIFSYCMKKSNSDLSGALMCYSAGSTKLTEKVLAAVNELRSK